MNHDLIKNVKTSPQVGGVGRKRSYVYLQLIHVHVWQKPTQHCRAIILQLNIEKKTSKASHTLNRTEIIFITHTSKLCVKGTAVTFPKTTVTFPS